MTKPLNISNTANSGEANLIVLTETWLQSPLTAIFQTKHILQSPLSRYQGVAIIGGKDTVNLQPLLPQMWTEHTIAGLLTKRGKDKSLSQLVIIAHYS